MSIGQIIDKFLKEYNKAIGIDMIKKPKSFALYQTWRWVDRIEKPRGSKDD